MQKSKKKDKPKEKKKTIPKTELKEDDQQIGLPDIDFKKFLGCVG